MGLESYFKNDKSFFNFKSDMDLKYLFNIEKENGKIERKYIEKEQERFGKELMDFFSSKEHAADNVKVKFDAYTKEAPTEFTISYDRFGQKKQKKFSFILGEKKDRSALGKELYNIMHGKEEKMAYNSEYLIQRAPYGVTLQNLPMNELTDLLCEDSFMKEILKLDIYSKIFHIADLDSNNIYVDYLDVVERSNKNQERNSKLRKPKISSFHGFMQHPKAKLIHGPVLYRNIAEPLLKKGEKASDYVVKHDISSCEMFKSYEISKNDNELILSPSYIQLSKFKENFIKKMGKNLGYDYFSGFEDDYISSLRMKIKKASGDNFELSRLGHLIQSAEDLEIKNEKPHQFYSNFEKNIGKELKSKKYLDNIQYQEAEFDEDKNYSYGSLLRKIFNSRSFNYY